MNDQSRKMFEVLVRENEGSLLTYLRCLVRDPGLVDDLFQETLITAWKKFDQFDESRPLAPWLRKIALNLSRNAIRSGHREKIIFTDKLVDLLEVSIESIEKVEGDGWDEKAALLKKCMERLSENSRQLISQRYSRGLNSRKIAEIRRQTSASIRKQLQRIRGLLADCIAKELTQQVRG